MLCCNCSGAANAYRTETWTTRRPAVESPKSSYCIIDGDQLNLEQSVSAVANTRQTTVMSMMASSSIARQNLWQEQFRRAVVYVGRPCWVDDIMKPADSETKSHDTRPTLLVESVRDFSHRPCGLSIAKQHVCARMRSHRCGGNKFSSAQRTACDTPSRQSITQGRPKITLKANDIIVLFAAATFYFPMFRVIP